MEQGLPEGQGAILEDSRTTSDGDALVTFQYTLDGVPVIGAQSKVTVTGQRVTGSNDQRPTTTSLPTAPTVTPQQATAAAVAKIASDNGVAGVTLASTSPELWILEPARLGLADPTNPTLVWSVYVSSTSGPAVFYRVLIDAQTGTALATFDLQHSAMDLRVCDAGGAQGGVPCQSPVRSGDPASGNDAVDRAYEGFRSAYDYFSSTFDLDSFDDRGAPIKATVNTLPGSLGQYNPFADSFKFDSGGEAADDIVAHEYSHAVVRYLVGGYGLVGFQGFAINEGLADIFGELVDISNTIGTDTELPFTHMGEDLPDPNTNLRSFADPSQSLTPSASRVGDSTWTWTELANPSASRYINMGVLTRFAHLIARGSASVRAIGAGKLASITYGAVERLTQAASFPELGSQLVWSCDRKLGTMGITSDDCAQVRQAAVEVGIVMGEPPTARGGTSYLARNPSTGRSVLIQHGNRYAIPSGDLFNCLAQTRVVWDLPRLEDPFWGINGVQLNCPSVGPAWTYTPTAAGGNTGTSVIVRNSGGSAWLVNAQGQLQTIPDGGTYLCLAETNPVIWNTPDSKIAAWAPVGSTPAQCGVGGGGLGTPGSIVRVTTSSDGTEANRFTPERRPAWSPDGTKIAFAHGATNLVNGDLQTWDDIYIKDLSTGVTTLASSTVTGVFPDSSSADPAWSPDGTKIAFTSFATNLLPNTGGGSGVHAFGNVYVKDLESGEVTVVSAGPSGTPAGYSRLPKWSSDGTRIAFLTGSLIGSGAGGWQVVVKDLASGNVTLASGVAGSTPDQPVTDFAWSPDGARMAFSSATSNYVPGDTNGFDDVFVKDLTTGAVTRVSTPVNGNQADQQSWSVEWSPDGTRLVFHSLASNLVPNDTNGEFDIFVKNLSTGAITRVSTAADDGQSNGSSQFPSWAPDSEHVIFHGAATNLVAETSGVYMKDLNTGLITTLTKADGSIGNNGSRDASWSPDGQAVAFISLASDLVVNDTNEALDIFVKYLN